MQAFRPGLLRVLEGTDVPVIPVYLDELWGSIFSFHGGRFFWKWPRKWPYPISIHFGPPVHNPSDIYQVRRAVQDLGAMAVQQRTQSMPPSPSRLFGTCKNRSVAGKSPIRPGMDVTGGALLMRTLIARRLLRREVLEKTKRTSEYCCRPACPPIATNVALALDRPRGRQPELHGVAGSNARLHQMAGIRHVLTSRKVMDKLGLRNWTPRSSTWKTCAQSDVDGTR